MLQIANAPLPVQFLWEKGSSEFAVVTSKEESYFFVLSPFSLLHTNPEAYRGENLLRLANKTRTETHVTQMSLQHTNESSR